MDTKDNFLAYAAWMTAFTIITLIVAIAVLGTRGVAPNQVALLGVIMTAGPLMLLGATMVAFKLLGLEHSDWL